MKTYTIKHDVSTTTIRLFNDGVYANRQYITNQTNAFSIIARLEQEGYSEYKDVGAGGPEVEVSVPVVEEAQVPAPKRRTRKTKDVK